MKNQSWLRKNWLWAAGGAFVGLHVGTWLMQTVMKRSVRSEVQLKHKAETEEE